MAVDVVIGKSYPVSDRIISFTLYKKSPTLTMDERDIKLSNNINLNIVSPLLQSKNASEGMRFDCPSGGVKPNISLSYKEVGSSTAYGVELKVKNTNLKNSDLQEYSRMYITFGYPDHVATISSPIFYAYTDSPAPDNTLTIGGVAVGEVNETVGSISSITFTRRADTETTLGNLIFSLCKAVGYRVNTPCGSPKDNGSLEGEDDNFRALWNAPWPYTGASELSYTFNSALEMLTWVSNEIINYAKVMTWDSNGSLLNKYVEPYTILNVGVFFVGYRSEERLVTSLSKDEIVMLNTVKSLSFTAGILTVNAPFNPDVHPSSMIWCPVEFYEGGKLFSQVAVTNIHKGKFSLYRVIKMEVQFSTMGNTNNMQLLCYPINEMTADASSTSLEKVVSTLVGVNLGASDAKAADIEAESYDIAVSLGVKPPALDWLLEVDARLCLEKTYAKTIFSDYDVVETIKDKYKLVKSYRALAVVVYNDVTFDVYDSNNIVHGGYTGTHLWPLIVQLTHELYKAGNDVSAIHNPDDIMHSFWSGDVLACPKKDDVSQDALVDNATNILAIYLNWAYMLSNYMLNNNNDSYKNMLEMCVNVYNTVAFLSGLTKDYLKIKGNYIEGTYS